jgi:hypothetical protein
MVPGESSSTAGVGIAGSFDEAANLLDNSVEQIFDDAPSSHVSVNDSVASGRTLHMAGNPKRAASTSVLDLAIDASGNVVSQICDNGSTTSTDEFGSTNSMPGVIIEVDAIVGMQMRHTSCGDYLSCVSEGLHTGRCQGQDVVQQPDIAPSAAARRLDQLREHVLGLHSSLYIHDAAVCSV